MSDDDTTTARRNRYAHDVLAGIADVPSWLEAALASVRRHEFLRSFYHPVTGQDGMWAPYGPDHILHLPACYTDTAWPLRLDPEPPVTHSAREPMAGTPIVECVQPGLLARMLIALKVDDTTTVLHATTGSGYGVALLATCVPGARQPRIRPRGRRRPNCVTRRRFRPRIRVTEQVMRGWPRGGPFDRIMLAAAVPAVPGALIGQVTHGGIIVVGLWRGTGSQPGVALTVTDDGTAEGHLIRHDGHLLPLPGIGTTGPTPIDLPRALGLVALADREAQTSEAPSGLTDRDFVTWATLQPGIHAHRDRDPNCLWYTSAESALRVDGKTGTITPYGPRPLDGDLVASLYAWHAAGEPTADRLGITITDRERFWCDTPDNLVWTPPPVAWEFTSRPFIAPAHQSDTKKPDSHLWRESCHPPST